MNNYDEIMAEVREALDNGAEIEIRTVGKAR